MSDPSEQPRQPAPGWAPPGAPPFGAPGWYAPPGGAPAGLPPQGMPQGALPRYAAPVLPGPGRPAAAQEPVRRSPALGLIALLAAVAAALGATTAGAIAAFAIGVGTGREIALRPLDADFDWSVLSPVRDAVLIGEVSFWVGTAVGIWALVQGIVAIATSRGRGSGIAAVVLAGLGPIVFFTAVQIMIGIGFATGAGFAG